MRLALRDLERGDQVSSDAVIGLDHLREAARRAVHQLVGQKHRERLVSDDVAGAPDRVTKAERLLLPNADHLAKIGIGGSEHVEALAFVVQRGLEFERLVEIVDQRRLAAAGDEDQLLDARLARLVDRILDQRTIDDRDHFLGDGLGGGE